MLLICCLLVLLPDITKCNANKINNMSNMFYRCTSIIILSYISKWDINKVNMGKMITYCTSLDGLPDISI